MISSTTARQAPGGHMAESERLALVVLAGIFVVLGALVFRPGIVDWDGAAHYAYLHSAIIDGDLDFSNEIVPPEALIRTPVGRIGDKQPIGPAILWIPSFFAAHAFCFVLGPSISGLCRDGYGWPYVTAISMSSAITGFLGLAVTYHVIRRVYHSGPAVVAVVAVWLASPLVAYMYVVPSMPHAVVFGVAAAFLAFWWIAPGRDGLLGWYVWGLAGGLLAIVRWQEVVWSVLPLTAILSTIPGIPALRWRAMSALVEPVKRLLAYGLGLALVFTPQLVVWNTLYGSALTIPQGDGFLMWGRPLVGEVLFSPLHGLFSWMPIAIIGVAGMWLLARRDRRLFVALAVIIALELYVNSIVNDWWGGGAFGPRRFIGVFPILMLGFAGVAEWLWRKRAALALLVTLCALLAAGNWIFMAEFYTALVLPVQPLTWDQAIHIATSQPIPLQRWLMLWPGIVGQWQIGPYGTVPSTAFITVSLGVLAGATLLACQWVSARIVDSKLLWRAAALGLPLSIAAIDLFIGHLR
jgi:hypothetical protein